MALSDALNSAIDRWSELHSARQTVRGKELLLDAELRALTPNERATFNEALASLDD